MIGGERRGEGAQYSEVLNCDERGGEALQYRKINERKEEEEKGAIGK